MTDTLKSICDQCIQLQNPQLDFIPAQSQRQEEIIRRDLKDLVAASALEHEKTAIILAGVLFESILYSFLQSQTEYIAKRRGVPFTFDNKFSLPNYINIFNRYFSALMTIPDIVIVYRNLVHIDRELQHTVEICTIAAPAMLRLLDALLLNIGNYPGQ